MKPSHRDFASAPLSTAVRAFGIVLNALAVTPGVILLLLPPGYPLALGQTITVAETDSEPREAAPLTEVHAVTFAPPKEKFAPRDSRVKPHGGRISLDSLDLSKAPSDEDLRLAGQMGGPLSPVLPSGGSKAAFARSSQRGIADRMAFGNAIQAWNEHRYEDGKAHFQAHFADFPDSPWAGESALHMGCFAQFTGAWEDARHYFEWILANTPERSEIWFKAKARLGVLLLDRGELDEAFAAFAFIAAEDPRWEQKTYARSWMLQIGAIKQNEAALRDCGVKCVAKVLRLRGDESAAARLNGKPAHSATGMSLGEVADLASEHGLRASAVRGTAESLEQLNFPLIAHYADRHFVVVEGIGEDGRFVVFDPRLHGPTRLSKDAFLKQWSGLAVAFEESLPDAVVPATEEQKRTSFGGCCGYQRPAGCLGPPSECDDGCSGPSGGGGGAAGGGGSPGSGGTKPAVGGGCNDCVSRGMPVWEVSLLSMNLVVSDTPLWYDAPVGGSIDMRIVYNSGDALNQWRPFGNKWTFDYASYAMEAPSSGAGAVLVVMPGGRQDLYHPDGQGGYSGFNGVTNRLIKTGSYSYTLEKHEGTVLHYNVPQGSQGTTSFLTAIEDRRGHTTSISHSPSGQIETITSADGRIFTFSYDTEGRVTAITDPWGRQALFSYDSTGNLVGQQDMGGQTYGYTYDADVNMTSIATPSGVTAFYHEPPDGVSSSAYPPPGGHMWENARLTVTYPDGLKEEFYYMATTNPGTFWHRDRKQYQSGQAPDVALSAPKISYSVSVPSGGDTAVVNTISYPDGKTKTFGQFHPTLRKPTVSTDENGRTSTLSYDDHGRVLTRTDARGHTRTYEYDSTHDELVKVTNHRGIVEFQKTLNPDGTVQKVQDALGRTTEYTYDALGRVTSVKDPAGNVRTMHYYAADVLSGTTVVSACKDRLESVKHGSNVLRSLQYDEKGRVSVEVDQNGYDVRFEYDDLNRITKVLYPDGTYQENVWACCGIERTRDRAGKWTQYAYDKLKRLVWKRDPSGAVTEFGYDPVGNLVLLRDGEGNATRWTYDSRNRLETKIYPDGTIHRYEYDGVGNLVKRTDAKGQVDTYAYDANDNLTALNAPGQAPLTFTYDDLDRRETMTDGFGVTTWTHNAAGQVTSVDGPWADDTLAYGYDLLGRVVSRSVGTGNTSGWSFDPLGRLVGETNDLGSFSYAYEATNPVSTRLTAVQGPGIMKTEFTYLPRSGDYRLGQIRSRRGGIQYSKFDYTYTASGNIATWGKTLASTPRVEWALEHDAAEQLLGGTLRQEGTGAVVESAAYSYDKAGNRKLVLENGLARTDAHNSLNQIVESQSGGVIPVRGEADEALNAATVGGSAARLTGTASFEGRAHVQTGTNVVPVTATDASGNVTSGTYQIVVGGTSAQGYSYDPNGNMLGDGAGRTYEWTSLDQLAAINWGTHRTEMQYDGLGRRVRMVEKENGTVTATRNFVWDGLSIVEERDGANAVVKRYYAQGETRASGEKYVYTRDHLGSVRELVSAEESTVAVRYDYSLWGTRTTIHGTAASDFGYTGHFTHAPTGLALAPYRAYDPVLGRWLSRDPIEERGGVNLYGYVSNNPIRYVDPMGTSILDTIKEWFKEWFKGPAKSPEKPMPDPTGWPEVVLPTGYTAACIAARTAYINCLKEQTWDPCNVDCSSAKEHMDRVCDAANKVNEAFR